LILAQLIFMQTFAKAIFNCLNFNNLEKRPAFQEKSFSGISKSLFFKSQND